MRLSTDETHNKAEKRTASREKSAYFHLDLPRLRAAAAAAWAHPARCAHPGLLPRAARLCITISRLRRLAGPRVERAPQQVLHGKAAARTHGLEQPVLALRQTLANNDTSPAVRFTLSRARGGCLQERAERAYRHRMCFDRATPGARARKRHHVPLVESRRSAHGAPTLPSAMQGECR